MIPNNILLIDDDNDFITLIKFLFEHDANWKIFTDTNGKEGIATAKLEHPDLILLDVVMPELDGLGVYAILKSNPSTCNIPIVFVSAQAFIKKIVKSQIAEDVLVITKPFDILKLPSQLKKLCNKQKIARGL